MTLATVTAQCSLGWAVLRALETWTTFLDLAGLGDAGGVGPLPPGVGAACTPITVVGMGDTRGSLGVSITFASVKIMAKN